MTKSLEKSWRLNVFEIALIGVLSAFFVVLDLLFKRFLPRQANVQTLYFFSAIFGVCLGKIKGPIAAFFADTISLIMKGSIYQWMLHYAFIWPTVALVSALLFENFEKKSISLAKIILGISSIILIGFLVIIKLFYPNFVIRLWFFNISDNYILIMSVLIFALLWIMMLWSWIFHKKEVQNHKKSKNFYKHLCFAIANLTFVYLIFRWMWEPYAYNEFLARFYGRSSWTFANYLSIAAGIITKSIIVLPITIILFAMLLEVILIFRKKYIVNFNKEISQQYIDSNAKNT